LYTTKAIVRAKSEFFVVRKKHHYLLLRYLCNAGDRRKLENFLKRPLEFFFVPASLVIIRHVFTNFNQ